jgi:hypothetical protein
MCFISSLDLKKKPKAAPDTEQKETRRMNEYSSKREKAVENDSKSASKVTSFEQYRVFGADII